MKSATVIFLKQGQILSVSKDPSEKLGVSTALPSPQSDVHEYLSSLEGQP